MVDVLKTFKTPAGDFTALKGITACFYSGEFVSIVGKSGSGKSTLANMITGIDHPTAGVVRIRDTYVHTLSESQMSIWRGRNLGIVFQFFQLLPMLSLLENVILPMDFCDMYAPTEREPRALSLLQLVGTESLAHKMPASVSGGQQQSTAIARALANDPPIIIADEPTGNLDQRTADAVFQIFTDLVKQGKTVIMVTHDINLARRTDRILLLSDGELINAWISQAFPTLPHTRLLWLTHQVTGQHFAPGTPFSLPGLTNAGLILITQGQLEINLNGHRKPGQISPRLGPGEYISLLDLQAGERFIAGLQVVGDLPLTTLTLKEPAFDHWMNESPPDRERLQSAALQHIDEWASAPHSSEREPA
jgi:putative ABC transport system ATP-binding protein